MIFSSFPLRVLDHSSSQVNHFYFNHNMIQSEACVATVFPPLLLRLRVREPTNVMAFNERDNKSTMDVIYNETNNRSQGNVNKVLTSSPSHHCEALCSSLKPPFPTSTTKKRRSKKPLPSGLPRSLQRLGNNESSSAQILSNILNPKQLKKSIEIDVEALTYYPAVESTYDPQHDNVDLDVDGSKSEEQLSDIENNSNINGNMVRKSPRKRLRRLSELVFHDQDGNEHNENSSVYHPQTRMDPHVAACRDLRPTGEVSRDERQELHSKIDGSHANSGNSMTHNEKHVSKPNENVDVHHEVQTKLAIPFKKRAMFGIM